MKYFVVSNLKHNQKSYVKGDEIWLESKSEAKRLIEVGVLQQEPLEEDVSDDNVRTQTPEEKASARAAKGQPSQEEKKRPDVGGEKPETGEPGLDGREEKESKGGILSGIFRKKDANDITPESNERADAGADAGASITTDEQVQPGNGENQPVENAGDASQEGNTQEPENDPSKDL